MKFPEQFRAHHPSPRYQSKSGDRFGYFLIPGYKAPGRRSLNVIATDGELVDWEHVSVSVAASLKTCT